MAKNEIDCDQLDAAKQIVEITKIYSGLVEKNNIILRTQFEICHQISICSSAASESVASTAESLADAAEHVNDLNNTTLDDLRGQFDDVNDEIEKTEGWFSKITNFLGKTLKVAAAVGAWALEKVWGVLKGLFYIGKQLISTLVSVAKEIVNIAKAILLIPVKAYEWLIGKANEMLQGGSNEWYAALQKVKAEYGALDQVAPKTLISMTRNTRSLKEVGLSAFKIYEGLGKRLEKMLEFAQKLGPLFENFADEFERTGLKIPTLAKGLGLTDEMNQIVVARAKTLGTKIEDQLLDVHKLSWELGKRYSFATKGISRDIVNAMKDVKHFGGASMSQLGAASVYAKSLGAELDKISGILDAFDTFENAADVAAKTAQTWNVDIDPYALLHEQDPASIIDNVREAFSRAGHDVTKFSRAEKDHLAQLYKLSPEMAQQLFSLHNQGISLENAGDAAKTASKSFNTLDGALRQLNKSIEYIPQSGGGKKFEGFMDAWWQGIERAIDRNVHTRGLFRDVARGLMATYYDAQRVFNAFIDYFPGVKQMIEGLKLIFNPATMGRLIRGINNEIIEFIKNLSSGKMDFGELISKIGDQFEKYLGSASSGGSKFLGGLKAFGLTVAKIAGQVIEWIGSMIAEAISGLANFITDKSAQEAVVDGLAAVGDGIADAATSIWDPIWQGFKGFWSHLEPALVELKDALLKQFPVLQRFFDLFKTVTHQDMNWDKNSQKMVEGERLQVTEIESIVRTFWQDVVEGFHNLFTKNDSIFQKILKTLEGFKTQLLILTATTVALGAAKMLLSRMPGIASAAATAGKVMSGMALGIAGGQTINYLTSDEKSEEESGPAAAAPGNKTELPLNSMLDKLFGGAHSFKDLLDSAPDANPAFPPDTSPPGASPVASPGVPSPSPAPPSSPAASLKPRERRARLEQANFSANLSFEQVGEAIGSIVKPGEGGSTIQRLVQSLGAMGESVGKKEIASAENVAKFFTHINTLASALGGMQSLVDIGDLDGEGNIETIDKNIRDFESLLRKIAGEGENSPLGLISSHMTKLQAALPKGENTVNNVSAFVEAIDEIAGHLKGVSGKAIDKDALATGLDSLNDALSVLGRKISTMVVNIGAVNANVGSGGLKALNTSTIQPFADGLKSFADHFDTIKGALADVASISKEFEDNGGLKIDAVTIGKAISGVTTGLYALSGKGADGQASQKDPLGGLSSALNGLMGGENGKWVMKSDFKDISAKISALNGFLVGVSGNISGGKEGDGLLQSFEALSNFSEKLSATGEYGKNLAGADFTPIETFLSKVQSSLPQDVGGALKRASAAVAGPGPAHEQSYTDLFDKIDESIIKSEEIRDRIQKTKGVATEFRKTLAAIPSALSLGGASAIQAHKLTIDMYFDVKLSTSNMEHSILAQGESTIRHALIDLNENGYTNAPLL